LCDESLFLEVAVSAFYQFASETLADGKVDDADVFLLQELLFEDGQLDLDDVKLLVELYCGARQRSPAFEQLFFAVLEQVFLADGEIQPSEQFYLLKMLYSDREIRPAEREFLTRLQSQSSHRSPEFDTLCETALKAPDTNWCVGGREARR
jgi:hypothetical protein